MKEKQPESQPRVAEIARKQRHLHLLAKVRESKSLTVAEIAELERLEQKRDAGSAGSPQELQTKGARPLANEKRERFCREYTRDLNGEKAALRAHYSPKSARVTACRLLTDANVQDRIAYLKRRQEVRIEITADKVLQELAKLAFSNVADFIKAEAAEGKDLAVILNGLTRNQMACIASIEETELVNGKRKYKLRFHDKKGSLELLGKHLSIFQENINLRLPEGCGVLRVPGVVDDKDTWEQQAKTQQALPADKQ